MAILTDDEKERLKVLLNDDMRNIDERLANMLVDIAMSAKSIASDINEIRSEVISILKLND